MSIGCPLVPLVTIYFCGHPHSTEWSHNVTAIKKTIKIFSLVCKWSESHIVTRSLRRRGRCHSRAGFPRTDLARGYPVATPHQPNLPSSDGILRGEDNSKSLISFILYSELRRLFGLMYQSQNFYYCSVWLYCEWCSMAGTPYLSKLVKAMKRFRSKDGPTICKIYFNNLYSTDGCYWSSLSYNLECLCISIDLKCKLIIN